MIVHSEKICGIFKDLWALIFYAGSGKFSYEPGKTYDFLYETETRTGIMGASEDKSSLLLMVEVHVEVMSPCEYVLKVRKGYLSIDGGHMP